MDSVFDKYRNLNTPIHKMDARLKIFALIILMVACFLPYARSSIINSEGIPEYFGYYANTFLVLGILALIIFIIMIISKTSFKSFLKSLNAIWLMIIFLLIFMVFIPRTTSTETLHPIVTFSNGYAIYWDGVLQCLHVVLRIILMLALTLILTSTTAPMDITYALDWYMKPLSLLKIPTQIFTMIISLALRFIPTLLEKSQRIMKAQKSRGVDFNKGFISAKVKSITTLIVPLLVSCFSISDDLSVAMYVRGYEPYGKRTNYKILTFKLSDLLAFIILLVILGFFIFLCVMAQHYHINFWEFFGIKGTW